ncbi:MAG: TetR/AcrR family transcriptional regulator C-terminal domain-containing protein [Bilifractor sp.]|jgi:probable dihydroxyacetone kinase regulator
MADSNITKNALANSMKNLMKEKPFEKISVIDICNGCGMNRKSFYYHFKDKYDLVNWIFYMDFITIVGNYHYEEGWDLLVVVAKLFYRDQDFYRAAFQIKGQNSFRDYFYESMTPIVSFFLKDIGTDEKDHDLMISAFCDAYLAIMERWLINGCPIEPEEYIGKIKQMFQGVAVSSLPSGKEEPRPV